MGLKDRIIICALKTFKILYFVRLFNKNAFRKWFYTKEDIETAKREAEKTMKELNFK